MDRLQQQDNDEEDQRWNEEKTLLSKNALILLSILAVATVVVSWYSASQPELLVWRLSLLLCCAVFIASRLLFATASAAAIILLVTFSGFTAALSADAVDPTIGVLLVHLTSHLAAGMLGYALAKHRQHHGLKVTPATTPPPEKVSEKQAKKDFYALILGWCYMGVITVVCAACMAWVVWYRAEYPTEYLVLHMFGLMSFVLLLWSMFLGVVLLRGVFIGETGLGGLLVSVLLLFLLSWIVLGDVGAVVVTSLGFLVWTGRFGYSLCVYNSFKHEEWSLWSWTSLAGKVRSEAEKGGAEQS